MPWAKIPFRDLLADDGDEDLLKTVLQKASAEKCPRIFDRSLKWTSRAERRAWLDRGRRDLYFEADCRRFRDDWGGTLLYGAQTHPAGET